MEILSGHPFVSFVSLLEGYTSDSRPLDGELSLVVGNLNDAVENGSITAENATLALSLLEADLGVDGEDFNKTLEISALASGVDPSSALFLEIAVSNGYAIVEGTSSNDTLTSDVSAWFVGGAGDDTIVGSDNGNTFYGGTGDDTLVGSDKSDTYIYRYGDGSDTITDFDPSKNSGVDTLTFTDVASGDALFSQGATNDLVITLSNGETVTINNHFDSDYDYGMDQISFSDGVTLGWQGIRDKSVADQKAGGSGAVKGTEYAENYTHALGDGSYVITDYDPSNNSGVDTLTFTDVASGDALFSQGATNDLVITLSNGETVTINNHFDSDYDYGMDQISFSDGVTLGWQGIRDKSVADQKASGSSAVKGTEYAENYQHSLGDGSYVITDYDPGSNSANDTLTFTDVNADDITFSHEATNNLVMTLPNGETITVKHYFDTDWDYRIERIGFADGTVLNDQEINNKTVADMKPTGVVTGSEVTENYKHVSGDGSYVITDYDPGSNSANDTFEFIDVNASDVTFSQGATNDLIMSLANGDMITINNHFDSDWDYKMEEFHFADGTVLNQAQVQDLINDSAA
ncbi:calcium-binding protein [Aliiroseovarius sp. 2305UL8-7]|uniref:calcium-binding protein n=1 Tax=Aliiroseovarius conchicola TaxID=3121637 RepID=UPI003527C5C3